MRRYVEAYVGEGTSGKSEVAVNRALELTTRGRRVTMVDLDIVKPCYTLRPIQGSLLAMGVAEVVTWASRDQVGMGETPVLWNPAASWVLQRSGDIVFGVGYGVEGAKALALVEGSEVEADLRVIMVINTTNPLTATVSDIVEVVSSFPAVHALVHNTHLGDETTAEIIQDGARIVGEAASVLHMPVVATTAVAELAAAIGEVDCAGHQVRAIRRLMTDTFW
ncbi:MAG: hypothetical protein M0028_10095 [Clostridia bacterium]|nr:hypothetical protein [Clostridia bacterium]